MNQYVAAIPYTTDGTQTGPYLWSNQGAVNAFTRPSGAPGCRVGAVVGQFLMLGDLYQTINTAILTSVGGETSASATLTTPMGQSGALSSTLGSFTAAFSNGVVTGTGNFASGTINYSTGALTVNFTNGLVKGDQILVQYTQSAPYLCRWSAIGDPTNWPIPGTQNALATQSGQQLNQVDLGPVMFIAGYPLYGLVFQRFGITRASYIGAPVVFSWQPYEFKRGLIAHGAAIQVGPLVYYLSDSGFFVTDGANVIPIGTAQDNSSGIDNWFWANVNPNALEAIRAGYDGVKRCVFFAIPTGSNVLPDTLLTYNPIAQRWTKAAVKSDTIWTADNGTDAASGSKHFLGVIDQTHTPNNLSGPPLTGYLETCDTFYTDGRRRAWRGGRPHVSSLTPPLLTMGTRNDMTQAVRYAKGYYPNGFTKVASGFATGSYKRARVTSRDAQQIAAVSLDVVNMGMV